MLTVTSAKRLGDALLKDVPTARESGVDVEWDNFRYILGGPNMPKYAVKYWGGCFGENGQDSYLAGNEDPIPLGRYFHDRWLGGLFGRSPGGRHRHCGSAGHGKEEMRE